MDKQRIEDPDDGGALVDAWIEGGRLVVSLQDLLERPAGSTSTAATIEVELGASVPLTTVAEHLGVEPADALEHVVARFRGDGRGLLSWARGLPDAQLWSHTDAW